MKYVFFVFIFLSIFSIAAFCFSETSTKKTTSKDVKEEVKDAAKSIKDYSVEQRDEAVKKAKTELDELDKKIDDLEKKIVEKWDEMDQAAREKSRKALKCTSN